MTFLAQFVVVVGIIAQYTLGQAFGPNTGSQWATSSGKFTALSFTVGVPETVPWTIEFAAWSITPMLFNADASTWFYFDEISYGNSTGTPANPETYQLAFYPCQVTGNVESIAATTIYPGDSVSIAFSLTSGTTWKETWSVAPGAIGKAAGAKASSGTYSFTFASGALFNYVWLQAEFSGCFWDFGDLTWNNIKMTASTTDTSWCTPYPVAVAPPGPGYNATFAGGPAVAAVSGSSSTCTLPEMTWLQPSGALAAEAAYQSQLAACAAIEAAGGRCHY